MPASPLNTPCFRTPSLGAPALRGFPHHEPSQVPWKAVIQHQPTGGALRAGGPRQPSLGMKALLDRALCHAHPEKQRLFLYHPLAVNTPGALRSGPHPCQNTTWAGGWDPLIQLTPSSFRGADQVPQGHCHKVRECVAWLDWGSPQTGKKVEGCLVRSCVGSEFGFHSKGRANPL